MSQIDILMPVPLPQLVRDALGSRYRVHSLWLDAKTWSIRFPRR
jgi:hypothetical protein